MVREEQLTLTEPAASGTKNICLLHIDLSVTTLQLSNVNLVSTLNCIHMKFRPTSKKTAQRYIYNFQH